MTQPTKSTPARANGNRSFAQDSMPKNLASGNQTFTPVKPPNLVRPQGVKPPPSGQTK
jgi:hypothetical protein